MAGETQMHQRCHPTQGLRTAFDEREAKESAASKSYSAGAARSGS
jgi:hypothetical protein